jgi:integrase
MAKRAVNGAGTVYRERSRWRGRIEIDGKLHEVTADTRKKLDAELQALAEGATVADVVSVEQIGRDRWVAQVYDLKGKRRKLTGKTRAEVEAKRSALTGSNARGEFTPDRSMTFAALADRWRSHKGGKGAQATVDHDEWALGLLVREFGSVRLCDLDVARAEEGMRHIAQEGTRGPLSKLSARRVLAMFRRVLKYAEVLDLIGRNPAALLEAADYGTVRERTTRALSADEASQLFAAAEGDWLGGYVRLGLLIGARPSELAALCWDAVDLEAGRLVIRRSRRKVGTGRYEVVDLLKTPKSRRAIPLDRLAVDVLKAQRAMVLEAQLAAPSWPHPELVFPSPVGTLLDPSNVRRDLKRLCKAAGVPEIGGPNTFRHTVQSHHAEMGVPPSQSAQLLGHTVETAWAHYTHEIGDAEGAASMMSSVLERR